MKLLSLLKKKSDSRDIGNETVILTKEFRRKRFYRFGNREIETFKSIFKYYSYYQNFVNKCIKKLFIKKTWIYGF